MTSARFGATSTRILSIALLAGALVHVLALVLGQVLPPDARCVHEQAHAGVESANALIALLAAALLISLGRRGQGTRFNAPIAGFLVAIGVLDGLHGFVRGEDASIWLKASAAFAGGVLLIGVWQPDARVRHPLRWPLAAFGVASLFGALSISFAAELPTMLEGGAFTSTALALTLSGDALLLLGAARLLLSGWRSGDYDELLFGVVALLLGSGALLFSASSPWDMSWWSLHLLELVAHGVALAFAVQCYARSQAEADRNREELEYLNATLSERVSAHTAELGAALELAQEASRAKSEFLANMSHEIRTPLNAVIGLTEVVLDTELSDFQRDHLGTVLDAGDSLLNVINDILDFSKIEAGKLRVERVPFHLEDAICDTLKPLALRAHRKGLELTAYVDPKAPRVIAGDPGRLRQVLTNLVSNAITYTEKGEVFVRVAHEVAKERLHLAVLDSGIGIEPRDLQRLFGSFEQADSSTTRRFGGTGLGLAIARELVTRMGGEIQAVSVPGVGSTFSFTLPCIVPEQAEGWSQGRARRGDLDGLRVLIVDDNTTNRTTLDALARSQGMNPVLADSAESAFQCLEGAATRGEPIQVVVSDVQMPGEDGFALAERIRSDERFADLPIVALTSAVMDAAVERCQALRIAARVMKPAKPSELFGAIGDVLAGREPSEASRPGAEEAVARAVSRAAFATPPSEGIRKILLVEDSAANRKLALALLRGAGHDVSVAENGREAVDRVAREAFDLVLMDVQMPEMDGLQATAAIRAAEAGSERHLPIIAMTAHALRGDRERCLAAGMDDYITKPIRREDLFRVISEA